jgi:hypothetical protein
LNSHRFSSKKQIQWLREPPGEVQPDLTERLSTYPFKEVEEKQRAAWAELPPAPKPSDSPKHLIFSFPIPVGVGDFSYSSLRRFVLADVHARLQGLQGSAVRFGATWNGFAPGVEACARLAQAAPLYLVEREREVFSKLLGDLAISLDPGAEIDLHHPEPCRWTQWLFLQLQKHKLVSWRRSRLSDPATEPGPGRGPAAERPRAHERRTGSWRLDLGAFGDRLLNDLDRTNWPISEKKDQRHLIGRRRGCEVLFQISHAFRMEVEELPVFTTQVEAIYGATFILIHPDHPLLPAVLDPSYEEDLTRYRDRLAKGTEPRISGARTGGFALNPANLKRIPVLVSALAKDPFLGGAAMGIPAHDPDQFELAKRMCLSIREAIRGPGSRYDVKGALKEAYTGDGTLTNSSIFSGLPVRVARERIIGYLGRRGIAQRVTRFRLQDVPLSVPGLWGIPVPMIHCPRCGEVTVPEESLPITLPATGPLPPAPGAAPGGGAGSPRGLLRGLKEDERGAPAAGLDAPDLRMLPGYSRTICPICSGPAERDPQLLAPWVSEALACFLTVLSAAVPVPVPSPPGAVSSPLGPPKGTFEGAVALSRSGAASASEGAVDLFAALEEAMRKTRGALSLCRSLDRIRERFGYSSVVSGKSLNLLGKLPQDAYGYVLRTPSLTR